jgi:hypothetical protein
VLPTDHFKVNADIRQISEQAFVECKIGIAQNQIAGTLRANYHALLGVTSVSMRSDNINSCGNRIVVMVAV